jgi:hypothetical protein
LFSRAVATFVRSVESRHDMVMLLVPDRVSVIRPPGAHSFREFRVMSSRTDAVLRVAVVMTRFPEHPSVGNRNVPVRPEAGKLSSAVQCVTIPVG